MWVMTENGDLVNLDQVKRIGIPWRPDLDRNPRIEVKAWEAHYDAVGVTLCTCDDKVHGKRIIADLATYIAQGVSVIDMHQVKHRGTAPLFGIPPLCETCGNEATRVVEGRYACDEHDGKRTLNEAFPEEGEA